VLSPRLRRQLAPYKGTAEAGDQPYRGVRVLLPLVETAHYKALQLLVVAKALQLRGASVRVVVCGQGLDACEIRSVRNQDRTPCWRCSFNERRLLPLFGLDCVTLADLVEEEPPLAESESGADSGRSTMHRGYDLTQCVQDSVVRHFYGAVPTEPEKVEPVRQSYALSAIRCLDAAQRLHESFRPDVVLGYMLAYSEWEPFYLYYRSQGVPFRLVSSTQFNMEAQVVHWPDLYHSRERFRDYLASRKTSVLTEREETELDDFMSARTSGSSGVFQRLAFFEGSSDEAVTNAGLSVDPDKRNIFLFSNVYWDVGMSSLGRTYSDVLAWVVDTVELIKDMPGCHLYIKTHPGERYDSAPSLMSVEQVVRQAFPSLPPCVTFITPELRLNTYDLFSQVDLGVVYNGTVGLEMLLSGIPVLATGVAPYTDLGFTHDPVSREEYAAMLAGTGEDPQPDHNDVRMLAYFYFIRSCIPWRLTRQSYFSGELDGLDIASWEELLPGRDPLLDHLCACIADSSNTVPEAWPGGAEEPAASLVGRGGRAGSCDREDSA
jgi:hypothetical protein